MNAQRLARLRVLLQNYPDLWHYSPSNGRTLHQNSAPDDLLGMVDTRLLAELVVLEHEYTREQLLPPDGA